MSQQLTVREYAQKHKIWAATIIFLTVLVMIFCLQGLYQMVFLHSKPVLYAFTAGMVGFLATSVGSLPGFFLNKLSLKTENVMLGTSAGMMLAAAIFSLLLPSIEASDKLFQNHTIAMLWVIFGMFLGVFMLLGIHAITPHEHLTTGKEGLEMNVNAGIWLFVLAIIIHNVPEGLALGISFAAEDTDIGIPFTAAIALQDMPEGLAVVLALCRTGISRLRAVSVGVLSGLMEPIGALLGVSLTSQLGYVYPLGLALSAGAMIFVVSHEVIPETHKSGQQLSATFGIMVGFCLLMLVEQMFD